METKLSVDRLHEMKWNMRYVMCEENKGKSRKISRFLFISNQAAIVKLCQKY